MKGYYKNKADRVVNKIKAKTRGYDYTTKGGYSCIQWWCECSVCGCGFITRSCHLKQPLWKNGCPSCSYINRTKLIRRPRGWAGLRIIFASYKLNSKKAGRPFDLTIENMREITQKNCNYCGCAPGQTSKPPENNGRTKDGIEWATYVYNGIDRINNNEGYTKENCVPCCGKCNLMKRMWSKEEFLDHVNKIYDYNNK